MAQSDFNNFETTICDPACPFTQRKRISGRETVFCNILCIGAQVNHCFQQKPVSNFTKKSFNNNFRRSVRWLYQGILLTERFPKFGCGSKKIKPSKHTCFLARRYSHLQHVKTTKLTAFFGKKMTGCIAQSVTCLTADTCLTVCAQSTG